MNDLLAYWPLLILPALLAAAPWVRRREWIRHARRHWRAHPSIDQTSHDRAEVVHDPLTDPATGRPQCSHGVLLSEGPCPLCEAVPKGPPHCGYWCEKTPAGRCRDRCVELLGEGT